MPAVVCGLLALGMTASSYGQPLLVSDHHESLSVGEKAEVLAKRTFSPNSFIKSAVTAGINQWQNQPPEWGQGMSGYGHRYGLKLANRGIENGIGFLGAVALHQDPRYFYSGETGAWRRVKHALVYTFMTRTDSGGLTFSTWRFAGNYGSQFISNTWRPPRDAQVGDALFRGTVSIGYDAASNIFKEFWPDIRKRVLRR